MDLRLFPLQTVLFPGMRMPLHIFEERYKTMIRECIEEDAAFGVLLIRSGAEVGGSAVPHDIGTSARIIQVEYLDDGRMNIFTIGQRRFRITNLTTTQPYLRGEVETIEQQEAEPAAFEIIEKARDVFAEYLRLYLALGDQWSRGVTLPEDPGEAADYIAARMDTAAELKQELLEQLAPHLRLQREVELIANELPDMRRRLETHLRTKTAGFGKLN